MLWEDCDLDGWSLRTRRGLLPGFPPSSVDLPTSGTWDATGVSERPMSGAAIDASACSLLPTTQAADGTGSRRNTTLTWHGSTATRQSGAKAAVSIGDVVEELLPTPSATPYGNNQSPSPGAAVRPSVDGIVKDLLPSPTAKDAPRTNGFMGPAMAEAVTHLLPTPRSSDAFGAGDHGDGGMDLRTTVASLGDATGPPSSEPSESSARLPGL